MYILSLYAGIIGLCVGSFLNVLADRLPVGEDVLRGRSHCDYCKRTLRWFELIPVLSFVWQRGTCRRCHKRLSFEYPAIEICTGLIFSLITWRFLFTNPWYAVSLFIVFSAMVVIFVADLKYFFIPDSMLVLAGIGGAITIFFEPLAFVNHILSGLIAFFLFYLLWVGTKKRGMGFGDVKFVFIMGLFLGFPQIVSALYVAFLTGAAVGIILILGHKKSLKSRVPFGPFLILGFVTALFISLPKLIGL